MTPPRSRWPLDPDDADSPWPGKHYSKRPPHLEQQLEVEFAGYIAAWRLDGTGIYCVAPSLAELHQELTQLGVELSEVVIEPIGDPPLPNEPLD